MLIDSAESNRPNPDTARNVVKSLLHWFTVINAAVNRDFLQRSRSASNEKRAENASAEAGAVAGGIENTDALPTTTESCTVQVAVDANISPDANINRVTHIVPDQQEIERRRRLVRMWFNDYWNGAYEKPAAFVERLDQAEDYLNERLAATGEFWRLDTNTRSNSPDSEKKT
jgi:hypothetical protein